MIPIWEAWVCQIELTNVCSKDCIYCSRFVRHLRNDQKFFMDLKTLEKALDSLEGWENRIGIIGGEPTLHPNFEEVCRVLQKKHPKSKYGLWTTGGSKFKKYQTLINETFELISYNEHNNYQKETCQHQPITIAIRDVVKVQEIRDKLINECWVQKKWAPTISPKGTFFCEVAYAIDVILDGPGGWPIEQGWWRKKPNEFREQINQYCQYCGMPIPLERDYLVTNKEKISTGNLALFKAHNLQRISKQDITIFDKELSAEEMESVRSKWDPENYRGDITSDRIMDKN